MSRYTDESKGYPQGPPRALELVKVYTTPEGQKRYSLDVDALSVIRNIPGNLGVAVIHGPKASGKSSILNDILDAKEHGVRPRKSHHSSLV